jgi:hypothetical protein
MKEGISSWAIEGDSPNHVNDKKGALATTIPPLAERKTLVAGTWSQEINLQLTNDEEIAQFNSCPFITAVLLTCFEEKLKMISFATLDCSALLMHEGSVSCRSPCREGAFVDLKLESSEPLLSHNKLITFEPLELNLHRSRALLRPPLSTSSPLLFSCLALMPSRLSMVFLLVKL